MILPVSSLCIPGEGKLITCVGQALELQTFALKASRGLTVRNAVMDTIKTINGQMLAPLRQKTDV